MTPLHLDQLLALVPAPALATALHDVHRAACEAVDLAHESCPDPLDVVSSELWTVAADASAYVAHIITVSRALLGAAGTAALLACDTAAADTVRRHPRTAALHVALDAARGEEAVA